MTEKHPERFFAGQRVLITGGLGFIGSNLARRLVNGGARVVLVDSLFPKYGGNLFNVLGIQNKLKIAMADIRDQRCLSRLIQGQDYLFNLAGQNSHLDSMNDPTTDLEINCKSQLSMLEVCRKKNPRIKIVYASTRQIYGVPDRLPVDEKHLLHPTDVNGINKMAGEWYHILYNNVYGIRACALRLTNTYGPRMRVKDARQTFLGWWIRQILSENPIEIWGSGRQLRDFNYVDDVVQALILAAVSEKANGQVFNLGDSNVVSLKQLAQLFVKVNGKGSFKLISFPSDRKKIDIGDYYGDFEKIRKTLQWRPTISLEEGLRRTLEYYRENKKHYW